MSEWEGGTHPDDGTLSAFVNGRLDQALSERIEAHLLNCEHCTERLDGLAGDDPLITRLREVGFTPREVQTLATGTRVGPYEIREELGRGGVGVVYRAFDPRLKREVALKVIPAHSDPKLYARMAHEAEVTAALNHPGIVRIYEVGEYDGGLFLALELLQPRGLSELTAGHQPQSPRWSAMLVRQVAEIIDYTHRQGLIHRDLKPANLLLDPAWHWSGSTAAQEDALPHLKVADFGLALDYRQPGDLTQAGMMLGTPDYMAPEQLPDSGEAVGPAADIYALGVILYELLCARRPFQCDDVTRQLRMLTHDDPPAPGSLVSTIPKDLETICLKCLEKKPHSRYASAQALVEDLSLFLAGEPINAKPPMLHRRLLRWARRKPMLATTLGLATTFYVLHLFVLFGIKGLAGHARVHLIVSILSAAVVLYAVVVQKIYESPGHRAWGESLFALLPPLVLFVLLASTNGPGSAPVILYLIAIPGSALIRATPQMVWFETALCLLSYVTLTVFAGFFKAETQVAPEYTLAFIISLLFMGVVMHLFLRKMLHASSSTKLNSWV